VIDLVGVAPERLLLGERQAVTVIVDVRIRVERFGYGASQGTGRPCWLLIVVVVEVERGLVLISVLDAIAIESGEHWLSLSDCVSLSMSLSSSASTPFLVRRRRRLRQSESVRPRRPWPAPGRSAERDTEVKALPSACTSTRRRNRVGPVCPALIDMYFSSDLGTTICSLRVVLTPAFTSRDLPRSPNQTLFLPLPQVKYFPGW
jgi:hypothetical protein